MGKLVILILFLCASAPTAAKPLTELQLFHRCYKTLTGYPVPLGHSQEKRVRDGVIKGDDACLEIFNSTLLSSGSGEVNATMKSDRQLMLNRFYSFHINWFNTKDFNEMMGFDGYRTRNSENLFDTTEPALALTYVLFAEDKQPYRSILEGSASYFALREVDPFYNARLKANHLWPSRRRDYGVQETVPPLLIKKDGERFLGRDPSSTSNIDISAHHIQVGELMGVKKGLRSFVIPNYNPMTSMQEPGEGYKKITRESALSSPNVIAPIDIVQNHGSGILGMNSFMILNWGLDPGYTMDGSVNMARRWTESWMNSLLCRELPVLRTEDVQQDLVLDAIDGVADFKRSTTCLRCHTTMDPAAAAARNFLVSASEQGRSFRVAGDSSVMIGAFKSVHPENYFTWPRVADSEFHLRTPSGVLKYRSTNGNLVVANLNGIGSIGPALANQVDPYQCAAKRYFHHLTGIDIELYDYRDPSNATKFASEHTSVKRMRNFIETLGAGLKSSQDLKSLVEKIIKSPYFRDSNYEAEEN